MEMIFTEILTNLQKAQYYSAITVSLSVPDICQSLLFPNERPSGSNKAGYIRWYNENLAAKYPFMTERDIYSLRNGVVHNGSFGHKKMQYKRIIFTIPNRNNNVFHLNILDDALNLDTNIFCHDMIEAARVWLFRNAKDKNVLENMNRIVQLRPLGLAPYMVGMPIIT